MKLLGLHMYARLIYVLALVTHVEKGFQEKLKTGTVFLDLTAAYDTVCKQGLLLKVTRILKCKSHIQILQSMLSERRYQVSLDGATSKVRVLQNGLPQGSVLAPLLFNLYTADIPKTSGKKFIYADDVAITTQAVTFTELEERFNNDFQILQSYFTS